MTDPQELVEVVLAPASPDTVAASMRDAVPTIQAALERAGLSDLLSAGAIQLEVERPFPVDPVVVVLITLAGELAVETYKGIIIPALQKRWVTQERRRSRAGRKGVKPRASLQAEGGTKRTKKD